MKVILLLLFLSIYVYADEEGRAGLTANYYFNSQTGTMIVDGFRGIYSFKEITYRPWQSFTPLIKHLKISGSVTSVGVVAFMLCENLQTLEIGEMVQYLDTRSFQSCTSLKSIVLPSNVLVIYPFAFLGCTSLSSIVISGDMIVWDRGAFWGCDKLQKVFYFGKNPPDYIKTEDCNFPPIGCGTPTDTISCAPFYCGCDKLGNISVPYDYNGTEFVGMPISKLNQGENINGIFKGSCGNDCQYEINMTSHVMKISGNGEMKDYENYKECPWFGLTELIEEILVVQLNLSTIFLK